MALSELDSLYREALHGVRFQRGIVSDLKDYYAAWNEALITLKSAPDPSSIAARERWRLELQLLTKKAERLKHEYRIG